MYRTAIALLAFAAFASTADVAAARDHCGPYRYWNGYRCAPIGGYYRGPRYYDPNAAGRRVYGPSYPCSPGWSLQDGVCKPYRGY